MRRKGFQIAVELLTLILLIFPPVWLALHWQSIPSESGRLHHSGLSLWVMPSYALVVYLVFSKFSPLSRKLMSRASGKLSGLRPTLMAYMLTVRMEALAIFAVLGLAMDRTALTGRVWSAHGFIVVSLTVVVLTILMFVVTAGRSAYTLTRSRA